MPSRDDASSSGDANKSSHKRPRTDADGLLGVILDGTTRELCGLKYSELLRVPAVAAIHHISSSSSYLYQIVALVLNVHVSKVTLLRQSDGMLREETSSGWEVVTPDSESKRGSYLCQAVLGLAGHNFSLLKVDPTRSLDIFPVRTKGFQRATPSATPTTTPIRASPLDRPSTPSTPRLNTSKRAFEITSNPSTPVPDTMALHVKASSPLPQTVDHATIPEQIPMSPRGKINRRSFGFATPAAFSEAVRNRDKCCVITKTSGQTCIASHIIPKSTIDLVMASNNDAVQIGNIFIQDSNDPRLGVLLDPGLDFDFDRYHTSIYIYDDGAEMALHGFLSLQRMSFLDFSDSSRNHVFKRVTNTLEEHRIELMWHHYRHAVIYNWGSDELRARLTPPDFLFGEEGEPSDDAEFECLPQGLMAVS